MHPIRTYVRRLHLYFGRSEQTRMNLIVIFPSILPFRPPDTWEHILLTEAFKRLLRSPLLTTLVFSKVACPGLLGECLYVENLAVSGPIDIGFQTLSPPIYKP